MRQRTSREEAIDVVTASFSGEPISPELEARVDSCCDRFERAWQTGEPPQLEQFLEDVPPEARPRLLRELLALEIHYRCDERGAPIDAGGLRAAHPTLVAEIDALLSAPVGASGSLPPLDFRATP